MIIDLKSENWSDNLLTNPNLEYWDNDLPRDWIVALSSTATILKDTGIYKSGVASARLTVPAAQTASIRELYSFEKGKRYRVFVWLRMSNLFQVRIQSYENVPAGTLNVQVTAPAINTWFRYEKIFQSNGNDMEIKVSSNSSSFIFWVDNIIIQEFEPEVIEMT